MKYCGKCGTKLDDSMVFCPKCGTKQPDAANTPVEDTDTPVEGINTPAEDTVTLTDENKKAKKKILPIALAGIAVVAIIIIAAAAATSKPVIMYSDYFDVSFNGYDGYGEAKASVDGNQMSLDLLEALSKKRVISKDFANQMSSAIKGGLDMDDMEDVALKHLDDMETWMGVDSCFSYQVMPNTELSNGDEVALSFSVDTEALKEYKITGKAEEKSYTVEGLPEVVEFDPFEGIDLSVEGYNGYGAAYLQGTEDYPDLRFSMDQNKELSNGDKVTITVESSKYNDTDYVSYVKEHGRIPNETQKTMEVQGLAEIEIFDPFEGIDLSVEGYSGYGAASLQGTENYPDLKFEIDQVDELSNGDKVTVTVKSSKYNEDFALYEKEYGRIPNETQKTMEVQGLEEIVKFDPFEGITLTCTGDEPYGNLESINAPLAEEYGLSYSADKTYNLKNGDIITITVRPAGWDYDSFNAKYIKKYGAEPTAESKEFTLDSFNTYVGAIEDIPEEVLTKMQKEAVDDIETWYTKVSNTYEDFEYVGMYFLKPKEGIKLDFYNRMYLIYKIHDSSDLKSGRTDEIVHCEKTYYKWFRFSNLKKLADGTYLIDYSDHRAESETIDGDDILKYDVYRGFGGFGSVTDYYYVIGYEDLDTMFDKCVGVNKDKCEWESSVDAGD